jgi:c-di-GMP-binding flagellar brake protein YcgR
VQTLCCDAELQFGDGRYLFSTNVLSVVDEADGRHLELVRPEELQCVQRRRFLRAEIRESSPVFLNRHGAREDESWTGTASMMNLSVDGMACLADRVATDAIATGDTLWTEFRVAGQHEPFTTQAVVRSKTPAGTGDCIVLGLQFRWADAPEQFNRLHAALEPFV